MDVVFSTEPVVTSNEEQGHVPCLYCLLLDRWSCVFNIFFICSEKNIGKHKEGMTDTLITYKIECRAVLKNIIATFVFLVSFLFLFVWTGLYR